MAERVSAYTNGGRRVCWTGGDPNPQRRPHIMRSLSAPGLLQFHPQPFGEATPRLPARSRIARPVELHITGAGGGICAAEADDIDNISSPLRRKRHRCLFYER